MTLYTIFINSILLDNWRPPIFFFNDEVETLAHFTLFNFMLVFS